MARKLLQEPDMRRFICSATLLLAACAGGEDVGKVDFALSQPGPWDIPAETLAIGDTQHVSYTGAGPWVGSSGCGGSLLSGTAELRDWLGAAYPQVTHIGGYSCRAINGDGTRMSVHATGRALDIMLPRDAGEADNDLGDPIGNYLIEHAEEIGIQYIIWDRWTWGAARTAGAKERSYGGAHPHDDHLHIELSPEAAAGETPWFASGRPLPESTCDALPPTGGTVEETSDCFSAYGPAAYWRSEPTGHGGSLLWTNAYENDAPSNWARWHLNLDAGGEYAVDVWAEQPFAVHRATRYELRHGDVEHAIEVDLEGAMGWVRLGTFTFAPGGGQHLSVHDNYAGTVGADQRIPADAVRLVRVDATMTEPPLSPAARVLQVVEQESHSYDPLPGGDPTLDDDPIGGGSRGMSGGCSSTGARSPGGWWGLLAMGLIALRRRR